MTELRRRSLTKRLLLLLVLVQSGVPVLGMAAWMLFSPYVTWTDVASASAERLLVRALDAGAPDRAPRLLLTDELASYTSRRPGFVYAALVDGRIAEGSAPALAEALARLGPHIPSAGQLALPWPDHFRLALFSSHPEEASGVTFVTAGNIFMAEDLIGFVLVYLPALIPIFGPSLIVAVIVVPIVIRRALRPLMIAARQADEIAFGSLDQRLSETAVPSEVLPLVRAVNAALDRVAAGIERQRLFHANAAHELRTPIAILQARLDALPELPGGHDLRRDTARIALLVEQLLAVERLTALGPGRDSIDLVPRVRALVADRAPLALRSGRAVVFSADKTSIPALVNGGAFDSAIANLIDNAVRAEPPGGVVEVRVGPGPEVTVTDHGPGIPPEERELVFEPFWRKDERQPGAGLGLAIVAEIMRLHQGEAIIAETPGGGVSFRLRFRPAT